MGGAGGVRGGQLIAARHTGNDDETGGHGANRLKGVRHALLEVGNKLLKTLPAN